jgi:hypothetical protein
MLSSNELRLRRALEVAKAEHDLAKARAVERQRELRRLQKQKQALTHHPDWHKYAIGAERHVDGFTGHMAAACAYLWSLPIRAYHEATAHFVQSDDDTIASIELQAINVNLADWTERGEAIILRREADRYWADHAAFGKWQSEHPDNVQWRALAMTARQVWLVERTAETLATDAPPKMSRGRAHDWLHHHGANLRIRTQNSITGRQSIRGVSSADLFDLPEAEDD